MTYFYSLYSSEIYSISSRLSYDGHLETLKKKGCRYKAMSDRPEVPIAKWMDCSRVAWVITSYPRPGNCYNTDEGLFHLLLFLTLKFLYHLRFIKSQQSPVSDSQNHCTYS